MSDSKHTPEYWRQQAALAESYAKSRPPADIRGYAEAMIDAKRFREYADPDPSPSAALERTNTDPRRAEARRRTLDSADQNANRPTRQP